MMMMMMTVTTTMMLMMMTVTVDVDVMILMMSVSPAREPLFQGMDPSLTKENGTKMVQVVPRWRKMGLRWRKMGLKLPSWPKIGPKITLNERKTEHIAG